MRLGRIILAGLAPLVGLSAFGAGMVTDAIPSKSAQQLAPADSLPQLLQAVAPMLISGHEPGPAPSFDAPAARAVLALRALAATPFRGSLWLLSSLLAVDLLARRHQRALLRC